MIKLKLTSNWCSIDENIKRLITQFKTCDQDISNIEFVTDDTYDIMVVFGYETEEVINNKPLILFPQEPTWSGAHQKHFNERENTKIFGFGKDKYSQPHVITECVAHMFYGGVGPWKEGFDVWNYQNIINNSFNKTKNICSFVTNLGIDNQNLAEGCLYRERTSLLAKLIKNISYIDYYGWPTDYVGAKDINSIKGHTEKYINIKEYKFCLCIENSNENFYVSEKFYDCILTNTIPIYFGCKNIEDYWPSKNNYIHLESITDYDYVENIISWINKDADNIYKQMLPNIIDMKQRYFKDFNLLKKIKKEI